MIRYTTISIIVKAEEEEINNNESKLSDEFYEIIVALEHWVKNNSHNHPSLKLEIEEE